MESIWKFKFSKYLTFQSLELVVTVVLLDLSESKTRSQMKDPHQTPYGLSHALVMF